MDNGIRFVCKGRCFIKVCFDIKIDFSCLKDFLFINVKNFDNVMDLKRDICKIYIVWCDFIYRYMYDVIKCMFFVGNVMEKFWVSCFYCENEIVGCNYVNLFIVI